MPRGRRGWGAPGAAPAIGVGATPAEGLLGRPAAVPRQCLTTLLAPSESPPALACLQANPGKRINGSYHITRMTAPVLTKLPSSPPPAVSLSLDDLMRSLALSDMGKHHALSPHPLMWADCEGASHKAREHRCPEPVQPASAACQQRQHGPFHGNGPCARCLAMENATSV